MEENKPTICYRCTRPLVNKDGTYFEYWGSYKKDETKPYKLTCGICRIVEDLDEYKKCGIITTKLMIEASLNAYRVDESRLKDLKEEYRELAYQNFPCWLEINNVIEKEISPLVEKFEDKHWLPYIKNYWNNSNDRGHKAKAINGIGSVDLLMWGCAGRVLITINKDKKDDDITLIFSDWEPEKATEAEKKWCSNIPPQRGGIQDIYGINEKIVEMLQDVISCSRIEFKPNNEVHLAGF